MLKKLDGATNIQHWFQKRNIRRHKQKISWIKIYEGNASGLVSNLILGDLLADEEYEELKKLLEKGREK